ncbi:MAG: hydrogenase nickel incorporation protein HypA [Euryarchaeota archaeon]|nr:hydrogenase nickel incorporation protein HypA [Euryarchaeota archaeon]
MHEWALAEGILASAIEYAEKNDANEILEVKIVLGELQDVEQEIVEFALEQMKKDTLAESAKFVFEEEPARFKCRNCGAEWGLQESKNELSSEIREDIHFVPEVVHSFMTCPACGSRDFEVVSGRGVYIKEMKVR